jgi:hypothetical protein
MSASLAIVGSEAPRLISGAYQEPGQPYGDQEHSCHCGSGLLLTQIADEGRHFIEFGVTQEARDVLASGGSIMNVARNFRKMLLEVISRMMTSCCQASYPRSGRLSL